MTVFFPNKTFEAVLSDQIVPTFPSTTLVAFPPRYRMRCSWHNFNSGVCGKVRSLPSDKDMAEASSEKKRGFLDSFNGASAIEGLLSTHNEAKV